jgi:hypothetical protein
MTDKDRLEVCLDMKLCMDCKHAELFIEKFPCSACFEEKDAPYWEPGEGLRSLFRTVACTHDFAGETALGELSCKRCRQVYRRVSS